MFHAAAALMTIFGSCQHRVSDSILKVACIPILYSDISSGIAESLRGMDLLVTIYCLGAHLSQGYTNLLQHVEWGLHFRPSWGGSQGSKMLNAFPWKTKHPRVLSSAETKPADP